MDTGDFDFPIPEPMIKIDEVWLESFVRKVIEKVKSEDFTNELFYRPKENK